MFTHCFGRIPSPEDPRDYKMAAAVIELEKLPRPEKTWHSDRVLNQGQTKHCHPAGTLVRMADNTLRPIEDVKVLDRIMSAEGVEQTVEAVMAHYYTGEMLSIRLRGHATFSCTPEHPILTTKGYVPAGVLSLGDEVALPKRTFEGYRTELYFEEVVLEREYAVRNGVSKIRHLGSVETVVSAPPKTIPLDENFGRLLGLYLAEGHAGGVSHTQNRGVGTQVTFSYGAHERDTLVAETICLAKEVLGVTARVQERPSNNCINVVFGGKHWALLFGRLCGVGAAGKQLAGVLDGPASFRRAILMGWIDGDGHRRRTSTMGITVSRALALQMHNIANDCGFCPVLRRRNPITNHHAKTRKVAWEVEWGDTASPHGKVSPVAVWRKVNKLSIVDFEGYVFNLEVSHDHSYVADGVGVHNCVGFSWAGWGIAMPEEDPWSDAMGHDIYKACKVIDREPGAENGSTVRSGAKVMQKRGKIATYFFASSIDEAADYVARFGPVVLGTNWYAGMNTPSLFSGSIRPIGKIVGGHAYLWLGVTKTEAIFRNSWGTGWGKNGDARMLLTDLKAVFRDRGEACAATERMLSIGGQ